MIRGLCKLSLLKYCLIIFLSPFQISNFTFFTFYLIYIIIIYLQTLIYNNKADILAQSLKQNLTGLNVLVPTIWGELFFCCWSHSNCLWYIAPSGRFQPSWYGKPNLEGQKNKKKTRPKNSSLGQTVRPKITIRMNLPDICHG